MPHSLPRHLFIGYQVAPTKISTEPSLQFVILQKSNNRTSLAFEIELVFPESPTAHDSPAEEQQPEDPSTEDKIDEGQLSPS
jgi:hypothetical protein